MRPSLLTLLAVLLAVAPGPRVETDFDLVVTNGRIVDGTGNPWYLADLGIKEGRIAAIGRIEPARGARRIDASGRIIAPGFIDVHTHVEGNISRWPAAENFLRMGVTSIVTGNCGSSMSPLGAWFSSLEKGGLALNLGSLIGHNTVRRAGMDGDFDRPPTNDELERMRELVRQAMRDGALGLSSGLEYIPGTYARTDEIAALARIAAEYGGLYATHMRNEGAQIEASIRESLEIGERAGCPVEISHFKISSRKRWGASVETLRMIEEARAGGRQVTVDQYLYPAGSTGIGILFPAWLFEGGSEKARERLNDPQVRARVRREVIEKARGEGFDDLSFAYIASHRANPSFNGKSIAEITALAGSGKGIEPQAEQAIEMLLAGGAQLVLQKMSEQDVERIIRAPFTMVASDAGVIEVGGDGIPHPRGFGNNARLLGLYVRERKIIPLEEAIRKMTSLPAQTFGLWDRGVIRPGLAADLVIFDDRTVADRATFQQPKQFPIGFDYVLVNGETAVEDGRQTGARAGRILRGRGDADR
jgi:N-acyl-D-amino-acid deacylase